MNLQEKIAARKQELAEMDATKRQVLAEEVAARTAEKSKAERIEREREVVRRRELKKAEKPLNDEAAKKVGVFSKFIAISAIFFGIIAFSDGDRGFGALFVFAGLGFWFSRFHWEKAKLSNASHKAPPPEPAPS